MIGVLRGALVAAVLLPGSAWALGFGDIRLKSALNAPLDAEIDISATADELSSLHATLASREQFARNGMEYPAFLNSATVKPIRTADGRDVLQLRTTDPVTEPFLTMLVQVSYARGQLIREYTVLLDPPVFASQSAAAVVSEPAVATQTRGGEVERSGGTSAPAPIASPASSPPAAAAQLPAAAGGSNYRVRAGDTLSGIVHSQLPHAEEKSALVAVYRANAPAFDGNMNVLRRNSILTLPPESELARVAPGEARAEVARQYREWTAQHGGGNGRLRLVPPSDDAVAKPAGNLQQRVADLEQQLAEKDRLLSLRSAELARLQQKGAAPAPLPSPAPSVAPPATANPAGMVASSSSSQASSSAAVATPPAASAAATNVEVPKPTIQSMEASGPKAASPKAASKPAPEPETSLLDWVVEHWYVPAAALALLLAAWLGLRVRRSRQSGYSDRHFDQFGGTAGELSRESSQTLPARVLPDTGSDAILVEETGSHRPASSGAGKPTPTISVMEDGTAPADPAPMADSGSTGMDQGDPLAEADFHMAYGLYDQAADLVSHAITREPERRELKLKLLEVFFVWGNKDKFLHLAGQLAESRDGALPGEWEKIVIMGRQIAPESTLFANSGNVAAAAGGGVDLNLEGGQNRIDFNLLGEPLLSGGGSDGVDLDLGAALPESTGGRSSARTPGEAGVDFLLDTPVRGEDGELRTRLMPLPAIGGQPGGVTDLRPLSEGPTAELPRLDLPEQGTIRMKLEGAAGRLQATPAAENTAELAIDDLGLDVGTMETPTAGVSAPSDEAILESGSHVLPDLHSGPEGNWLLQGTEDSSENTLLVSDATAGSTAEMPATAHSEGSDHDLLGTEIDATLSGIPNHGSLFDTRIDPAATNTLTAAATALMPAPEAQYEQPGATTRVTTLAPEPGSLRVQPPTPAVLPEMDPPTMSEVGTKLDLARAYMDMGDPDGARSILDEVLAEGSASQKQEARRLIDSLPG